MSSWASVCEILWSLPGMIKSLSKF
jgi:hypothetical protein